MANSSDGSIWSKPQLQYYGFDGACVVPGGSGAGLQPTNVVFQTNDTVSFPGQIILDPTAEPQERFKMTYEGAGGVRMMYMASAPSPAGPWSKRDPELPIIPVRLIADTATTSTVTNTSDGQTLWTVYGRRDMTHDDNTSLCEGAWPSLRRVMAVVSNISAFGPYSDPVEVVTPGAPDTSQCLDDYNAAPIVMSGLTFLQVNNFWHFSVNQSSATGYTNRMNDGIQDIRLAMVQRGTASVLPNGTWLPDNVTWVSREPLIRRGQGLRHPVSGGFNVTGSDLDAGFVFGTAGGLLDLDVLQPPASALGPSDAWPFPYSAPSPSLQLLYWGGQGTHTGGGRWPHVWEGVLKARVRREGLARLQTPDGDPLGEAALTTVPLALPASACTGLGPGYQLWMLLNLETSVGGYITVELRDASTGVPLPGYTAADSILMKGNSIRLPVGWMRANNTAASATGAMGSRDPPLPLPATYDLGPPSSDGLQPLGLAFAMKHARLYSWDLQCVKP